MELDQSVISIATICSIETKVIDSTIEEREPVLHQNDKDTTMYVEIPEECDDVKKVMGEVSSLLTLNGL